MTCSEVQDVLPELIDAPEDGNVPFDFQTHLNSCADCSELVSELRTISDGAKQLTNDDEPSPLLWLRIAAQLRSEGLIRDQADLSSRQRQRAFVPASPHSRWRMPWLIPVAAMLLAAGAYVVKHQPAPLISERKAPATPVPVPGTQSPSTTASLPSAVTPAVNPGSAANQASTSNPESNPAAPVLRAAKPTASADSGQSAERRRENEEAAPSDDDQQFLTAVSTFAPAMKATYEKQLQAVNADIRETQAYVDQNPGDADARQHLMEAYQQKALLYQIALDRIQ
jgi:hypothetical protein